MCSIPAAALILSAAGTVSTVLGQQAAGAAAQNQANYNSAVATNNAILADQQAADERLQGSIDTKAQRDKTRRFLGSIRANAAGRGVLIGEAGDSVEDFQEDVAGLGELDALTIQNNAERRAVRAEQTAQQFRTDAEFGLVSGANSASAASAASLGTVLSGTETVARRWYGYKNRGTNPYGAGA